MLGLDETKLTEGIARALTAAVYTGKASAEEILDTYTIHLDLKITFEKKEPKS